MPTETDETDQSNQPRRCLECRAPLMPWQRAGEMCGPCQRAYQAMTRAFQEPSHEPSAPPVGAWVTCAFCHGRTNGYLPQPTPDGPLFYCIECASDLIQLQMRACSLHGHLPPLTDFPGERICHVAQMASKHCAVMHGDGWQRNEVSDLLRVLGVRQDYEGHDSPGDWRVSGRRDPRQDAA